MRYWKRVVSSFSFFSRRKKKNYRAIDMQMSLRMTIQIYSPNKNTEKDSTIQICFNWFATWTDITSQYVAYAIADVSIVSTDCAIFLKNISCFIYCGQLWSFKNYSELRTIKICLSSILSNWSTMRIFFVCIELAFSVFRGEEYIVFYVCRMSWTFWNSKVLQQQQKQWIISCSICSTDEIWVCRANCVWFIAIFKFETRSAHLNLI